MKLTLQEINRPRCLIQGCVYGLPFSKPKKKCMFCGQPRQEIGIWSDIVNDKAEQLGKELWKKGTPIWK